MRHISIALACAFSCILFTSCGGGSGDDEDHDQFATYQACFDEHTTTEGFDAEQAIEICCLSHPIGDQDMNVVCGDTDDSCETYVTANLSGSSAGSGDIDTGCMNYVTDRAE